MTYPGKIAVALLLLSLFSCRQGRNNYHIVLQDGWKFSKGDDLSRALPAYTDTSWAPISVGTRIQPAVFEKYDGYGWYRIKVFIPSSIRSTPHIKDSLLFFLGKIDDCDQVYLNGRLLGQNTRTCLSGTAPDPCFIDVNDLWQKERKYVVSITDDRIKWDQLNTVAIRVYDQHGGGGIFGRKPYVGMMDLNEYIVYDMSRFYTLNEKDSLERRFCIKNISREKAWSGILSVVATDRETGVKTFEQEKTLDLPMGDSALIPVTLPVSTDSLDVRVIFRESGNTLAAVDSVTIPYAFALHQRQPLGDVPFYGPEQPKRNAPDPALNSVIARSGNEAELKKVLTYYSRVPGDSLKWKAASFYIRNLEGFYYYEGVLLDKYQEYLRMIRKDDAHGEYFLRTFNDLYGPFARERISRRQDLREVTAVQLEQNIDMAFMAWKEASWGKDVPFDRFCELILPFRIGDEMPDYHRKEIYDRFHGLLDSAIRAGSPADAACGLINRRLMERPWLFTLRVPFLPHFPASQLLRYQAGSCKEMTDLAVYTMRAVGIPVAIDFIPQWPYRSYGHEFNSVLGKDGKMKMFMGNEDDPDNPHKPLTKKGKVYRHTFAPDPGSLAMRKTENDQVPFFLNDPRIRDVTDEYVPTVDVSLTLPECPSLSARDKKYSYLTVFDNNKWMPVHWGEVRGHDRQVLFTKMEGGIVYMPGYYDGLQIVPADDPFILSAKGFCTWLRPNKKVRLKNITLTRIYPVSPDVWDTYHMRGGRFQGSEDPDFRTAQDLYTIPKRPDPYWNQIELSGRRSFRYVRYFSPHYTHMGEMEFFGSGHKLNGRPFGTPTGWYKDRSFDKAFDGSLYTFFDPAGASGDTTYAGLDLGKKVRIDRIRFATPLTETNTLIVDGHTYELFYWEQGHWISCGLQDGRSHTVTFSNIPSEALYYIQDQSQENDCRIFTCDKGMITWW